ncbi:MAG: LptF/LptG family permease [Dongiaceae bacterium]
MRGITRYIGKQIALAIVFITVALTLAVWLSQTMRFIDTIVNSGLPLLLTLKFLALLLPSLVTIILPTSVFVAVVFVYWKMTNDRELVALQTAGVSPLRIARPALIVSIAATALGYALTLYMLPASYRAFSSFEERIHNDFGEILLPEGVFSNVTDDMTIYARKREGDGVLLGLMVYDGRDPAHVVTYTAKRGVVSSGPNGPSLTMEEGSYQETDQQTRRTSILYFDRVAIAMARDSGRSGARQLSSFERYLPELLNPVDLPPDSPDRGMFRVEAHQRLLYPLYIPALAVLGLALLMTAAPDRSQQRTALTLAWIGMAALQFANLALRNAAFGRPMLVPLMYLGPLLPLVLGGLLLVRPWRGRRPRPAMHPLPVPVRT